MTLGRQRAISNIMNPTNAVFLRTNVASLADFSEIHRDQVASGSRVKVFEPGKCRHVVASVAQAAADHMRSLWALIAQIAEANRSIQTATDFGERALYCTERMPRLLQWQTERTVQALLENPDLQRSLASVEQVSKTVAEEVAKFDERQAEVQKILDQANQVAVNGKSLMIEARRTGEAFADTLKAFDQLAQTMKSPVTPGETSRRFDITEFGTVFEKGTSMAHEARLFVDSSLRLEAAPEFNNRIADIEAVTEQGTDHMALRVAQLIVLFFLMLFLYRLCVSRLGRKTSDPPPAAFEKSTAARDFFQQHHE